MKEKYEAAFIIPIGASREFETDDRLPLEIKRFLTDELGLRFLENYLGIDSYVGENIKASVFHDDEKKIENVYFQVYSSAMTFLSSKFHSSFIAENSELFIPSVNAE